MIITGPQTPEYGSGWDRIWGPKEPKTILESLKEALQASDAKVNSERCTECGQTLIYCETCEDFTLCPTHRHGWDSNEGPLPGLERTEGGLEDRSGVRQVLEPLPVAEGGVSAPKRWFHSSDPNQG